MPQIRYEFVAAGEQAVLDTIKRVDRAANQAARSTRAAATGGAGGGPAGRGYKADPQMDAYWKASVKAAEQQGRAMQREHERQYRDKERHNARLAAAEKRAAEKRTRDHERAEAKTQAVRDKAAAKEAAQAKAKHDKEIADWRKKQEKLRRGEGVGPTQQMTPTAIFRGALKASLVSRGIEGGLGLARSAVGAGFGNIQNAVRGAMALQEQATRTAINARGAGDKLVDPQTLMREFQTVAINTPGVTAEEVTDAVQKFVTLTGDLATGRKAASTFASVASATGSSVGDVAQASASISNQFGLKTDEEIKDVLTSLTFQGKQGAFELADAASQFQRLAAAGAAFGLTGAKGVKTIGGLAQIARTGTGSAEQTTTAIENIFSNLTAKSAVLKKQGVDVFDKKTGRAREVTDVLIDAIAKSGGTDFEKKSATLRQVFGDQGIRGILPLLNKFQTAFNETQGTDAEKTAAGVKRLREEFEKSINAPGTWEELQKDAATQQATMSAQVTKAYEQLKFAAADQLAPSLLKMVPTFTALIGASAALVPAIETMTKYMGYGVKALQDAGILEDMGDQIVNKAPTTVGEALQRKNELLESGVLTADQMEEVARLDAFVKESRIKTATTEDLQKQKNAIYGKGGEVSPEDAATLDLIDAQLASRKKTDFERYAEQDPYAVKKMTEQDFVNEFALSADEGADIEDEKARARRYAFAVQQGFGTDALDLYGRVAGENDAQRAMVSRYKTDHAEGVGLSRGTNAAMTAIGTGLTAMGPIGELLAAFMSLSVGAKEAANELSKVSGQPSITGAPAG